MDEEARALVGLEDISVMRRPRARGLFRYDVPIPSALQMVFIVLYATLETVTLITSVVPMVQAQVGLLLGLSSPGCCAWGWWDNLPRPSVACARVDWEYRSG